MAVSDGTKVMVVLLAMTLTCKLYQVKHCNLSADMQLHCARSLART